MKQKAVAALRVFAASLVLVTATILISAKANAQLPVRTLSFAETVSPLNTPEKIASYLWKHFAFEHDQRLFGKADYWQSPSEFLSRGRGDCEDFAVFAAEALKTHKIPAFILNIYGQRYAHTICIFKLAGKYGAIDGTKVLKATNDDLKGLISEIQPFWEKAAIVSPSPASKKARIMAQFFAKS